MAERDPEPEAAASWDGLRFVVRFARSGELKGMRVERAEETRSPGVLPPPESEASRALAALRAHLDDPYELDPRAWLPLLGRFGLPEDSEALCRAACSISCGSGVPLRSLPGVSQDEAEAGNIALRVPLFPLIPLHRILFTPGDPLLGEAFRKLRALESSPPARWWY